MKQRPRGNRRWLINLAPRAECRLLNAEGCLSSKKAFVSDSGTCAHAFRAQEEEAKAFALPGRPGFRAV